MKHITTIAFMLVCATISAQDTLCVMITLDEIITFNFQTSEVLDRTPVGYDITFNVAENEVLCLHFLDEKRRFRDVTTTYSNGKQTHNTLRSKSDVYYSSCCGDLTIEVGQPKRTKKK